MPIRDVAAMNASLDNDYGATHGPNAPASHDLALFDGDPMVDGVELDATSAPGYARVSIDNDASWAPSVDGMKATVVPVQFADATDAWLEYDHWALMDGDVMWHSCPLILPVEYPTEAGGGPQVAPVVFYDDSVESPA